MTPSGPSFQIFILRQHFFKTFAYSVM